jgi:hypothetical protein
MIKFLGVILALTIGLVGCTKTPDAPSIGCTVESAVSGVVSLAIASELQCSNQAAIAASIAAAASKAGICASAPALAIGKPKPVQPVLKSVGSDICNTVASGLLGSIVGGVVPSAWGCTNANVTAQLSGLISSACAKTFP